MRRGGGPGNEKGEEVRAMRRGGGPGNEKGWRPQPPREIEAPSLPAFVEPRTREDGRNGAKEQEESTASPSVMWEGRAMGREPVPDNLPLVMGEALPVVTAKMVKRILKGDMAEFLKDNAEAERRRATVGESGQAIRGSWREYQTLRAGCNVLALM